MDNPTYDAFISYSHQDLKWGVWLQKRLESYPVPSDLRPNLAGSGKRLRIFRDQTDLAGAELQSALDLELAASRALIVICSTASAHSKWVAEEIRTFKRLGRADRIIPFIVEGEPESDQPDLECYPEELRNIDGQHLLGANVLEIGRNKAFLKLLAILLGIRLNRLVDREKQHHRRVLLTASLSAFAVAASVSFLLWRNASIAKQNQELSYDMYGAAVVSMTENNAITEESLDTLTLSAEAGNTKAMLMLADCYLSGKGTDADPSLAFHWYRRAAEAGDTGGMTALASCYRTGTGTEPDPELSFEWDKKAADAGDATSMFNIAACYEDGYVVDADPESAFEWYKKAAEAGYDLGMYNLARCYMTGTGTPENREQAFFWTSRVAETGNPEGMYNLAMMYQFGYGTEEDPSSAYLWYRKAADAGDADAMFMTAWCIEQEYGIKDPALEWYEKAAAAGSKEAADAIRRLTGSDTDG